jgi:exopolyphosphatase/guanosine-5'-triphosphate,3'-diphosphate pyrophosphatase
VAASLQPWPARGCAVAFEAIAVRCACIDIGSNTTRLLVADCERGQLGEVHQERHFTRLGQAIGADGRIGAEKIGEVVRVVAGQAARASALGVEVTRCVATASVRRARNGAELAGAIGAACDGLLVEVLSGEDEARLAFLGASKTLEQAWAGRLAVVDVGGGSSEIVVGARPDAIEWWRSFPLGSGDLTQATLRSDPPSSGELARARRRVAAVLGDVAPPPTTLAVAVGGSATSLLRLAGPVLDEPAFARALGLLSEHRRADIAGQFGLDVERVRLLPAGLIILEAVAGRLGRPLHVGRGGIREGAILEAAG